MKQAEQGGRGIFAIVGGGLPVGLQGQIRGGRAVAVDARLHQGLPMAVEVFGFFGFGAHRLRGGEAEVNGGRQGEAVGVGQFSGQSACGGGIEPADAFDERRVGGGEAAGADAAEHQVGVFVGFGGGEAAGGGAGAFAQGFDQRGSLAGELHGRSVGHKFALAAHGGLQPEGKHAAYRAKRNQEDTKGLQRQGLHHDFHAVVERMVVYIFAAAVFQIMFIVAAVEEIAPAAGDALQAVQPGGQIAVEAHVAVANVAEFVGDDGLQLVAREQVDGALGNADDGASRAHAGGKGVDAAVAAQQVHRRGGQAGRQRGFRHHVEQPPFGKGGVGQLQGFATQPFGYRFATTPQLAQAVQAQADGERAHKQGGRQVVPPQAVLYFGAEQKRQAAEPGGSDGDCADQCQHIEHHQPHGAVARLLLAVEEAHGEILGRGNMAKIMISSHKASQRSRKESIA